MKVYKNSWEYKLWAFSYEKPIPKDGCTYLKKLIAAVILFIPMSIFSLPSIIIALINGKVKTLSSLHVSTIACNIGLWLVLFIMTGMIGMFFNPVFQRMTLKEIWDAENLPAIVILGVVGWALAVLITLLILFIGMCHIYDSWNKNTISNNFLVTYYRTIKDKYCPKVEVIDNETTK